MRYARQYYREIQLHKMQVFIDFCRHKTLTKTGRALGMTTSDVNNVIMSIEKTLGGPVFLRKSDRLVLTEAGEEFLKVSESVLGAIENIDLNVIQEPPAKELNVAASIWDSENILPQALRKFRNIHPDVTVNLMIGTEYMDLTDNDYDVSLGLYISKHTEINQRFLMERTVFFYGNAEYLKKNGHPTTIESIKNHKLFIHKSTPPLPDHLYRNNTYALVANSYAPLVDAAINGDGLALLPNQILTKANKHDNTLLQVVPEFIAHQYSIFFLSRQKTDKKEYVETLFGLVKEQHDQVKSN